LHGYLFYHGADCDHKEMKFAYAVYKMTDTLRLLSVIDDEFEKELNITVNRSIIFQYRINIIIVIFQIQKLN